MKPQPVFTPRSGPARVLLTAQYLHALNQFAGTAHEGRVVRQAVSILRRGVMHP